MYRIELICEMHISQINTFYIPSHYLWLYTRIKINIINEKYTGKVKTKLILFVINIINAKQDTETELIFS